MPERDAEPEAEPAAKPVSKPAVDEDDTIDVDALKERLRGCGRDALVALLCDALDAKAIKRPWLAAALDAAPQEPLPAAPPAATAGHPCAAGAAPLADAAGLGHGRRDEGFVDARARQDGRLAPGRRSCGGKAARGASEHRGRGTRTPT